MKRSALIAILGLLPPLAVPVFAQESTIVTMESYALPPYDSTIVATGHFYSHEAYEAVRTSADYDLLRLVYLSDGLPVVAHLVRPAGTDADLKQPVIIFLRGGYVVGDQMPVLAPFYHALAAEGFVVLAPQLRGSAGAPGHDEMGGADVADVTRLPDVLRELPGVDLRNVFLLGESRGGIMAYRAIQDGMKVRAAVTYGAITDLERYLDALSAESPERVQGLIHTVWPDFDSRGPDILRSRSALEWADVLDVPLMIMHGGADNDVSPTHSLDLARALTKLGREYGLIVFAGDGHTLPGHERERNGHAIEWFRDHMAGE